MRRRGRKLLATKRAGELTPGARRVRLLQSLLDGDPFPAAVAELTLAALAQDVSDVSARVAEAIAAEGWCGADGTLPDHAVPSTVTDVRRVLLAIGAADGDAPEPESMHPHRARPGRRALRLACACAAPGVAAATASAARTRAGVVPRARECRAATRARGRTAPSERR